MMYANYCVVGRRAAGVLVFIVNRTKRKRAHAQALATAALHRAAGPAEGRADVRPHGSSWSH